MYEVEQKFCVDDLAAVESDLLQMGVTFGAEIRQVDSYYAHPSRDFARTDEAFRLRQVGEMNRITYKGPKIDKTTKTRREIELPLPAGGATRQGFAELLTALGFTLVADVSKRRRTATLSWEEAHLDVMLDVVDDVGSFVELETQAEESGLAAARDRIASLARKLGLRQVERRSYLELLLDG